MAAYYILTHTITDLGAYQKAYIPAATQILAKHQGEVIAATFKAEALQGTPPDGAVVVRFPSEDAVRAFVNDPAYQPLKKIRLDLTTDANAVLVPAFTMPGS